FLQARLQPASPDPSQKMQQNMMKYGLPLMFGVMSFFFPAGLTLYIFTNTCLSALHSIYMNKFDKKSIELAAKIKAAQDKAAAEKAGKGKPVIDAKAEEKSADNKTEGDAPRANPNRPRPQGQR